MQDKMSQDLTIRWGVFEKRLTLKAGQESLLSESSPRLIIQGPPGTGKSIVLLLKGLEWLKAGHDVIVFGLHRDSMPTTRLVYLQLSEAYTQSQGSLTPDQRTWGQAKYEHVILHDANNLEASLQALLKHGKDLHVLMDDFCPEDGFAQEMMLIFMRELIERDPGLHVWMTHWYTQVPEGFTIRTLTEAIRYPVPVFREIRLAEQVLIQTDMVPESHGFSSRPNEYFPEVIHFTHSGRGEKRWPINSEKCGRKVARILRNIGVGPSQGATSETYQLRDVLIVTRNSVDPFQPPAAFLRGLEASGFPSQVFARSPEGGMLLKEDAFDNVILGKENKVTLMNYQSVRGLDRRVVVCLTGAGPGSDEKYELDAQDKQNLELQLRGTVSLTLRDASGRVKQSTAVSKTVSRSDLRTVVKAQERRLKCLMILKHRLNIWSRASEQLIVVHLPKKVEGEDLTYREGRSACAIL